MAEGGAGEGLVPRGESEESREEEANLGDMAPRALRADCVKVANAVAG